MLIPDLNLDGVLNKKQAQNIRWESVTWINLNKSLNMSYYWKSSDCSAGCIKIIIIIIMRKIISTK